VISFRVAAKLLAQDDEEQSSPPFGVIDEHLAQDDESRVQGKQESDAERTTETIAGA
jgi:hypothetical protein